ncbi:uncharacterized protein LOC118598438 [Oryzias melastigma]|uniref:uncharacterized protein LOC118598438 n=1 Tax=Oryzias melastigma TaxID=30732 RepID=UPI00168D8B4E|nr:uncharacterized protein LOC118598438 [Oryzias melastigma]
MTLKAVVNFKGEKACHHSEELRRRPVRGDEREALAEVLITKLPRSLHLEKIAKLDENIMESGCRDQSLSHNFCGFSLQEMLSRYFTVVTGQAKKEALDMPILHRCLSHIMKNAKDLCKKHAPEHYRLAMHVFGYMTQAETLVELDGIVTSAAIVFSSSHSGDNVEKHFQSLQMLMSRAGQCAVDVTTMDEEDYRNDVGPTPFQQHFEVIIERADLDKKGENNVYFCPTFIPTLLKYFLPQVALWSGILLG